MGNVKHVENKSKHRQFLLPFKNTKVRLESTQDDQAERMVIGHASGFKFTPSLSSHVHYISGSQPGSF